MGDHLKKALIGALVVGALTSMTTPASAHVTVQPNESIVGTFSRFVVRVPTEREVPTIKITVELPPLAFVSFEPKEGWKRTAEMIELDEPIEVFGQEITETVGSVTWAGGSIGPGEFDEFGFSARMPDEETSLVFTASQTYQGGEVVEWAGAPDSEEPAALVTTYDLALDEGQGQLAALAELRQASAEESEPVGSAAQDDDAQEDEDGTDLGLWMAAVALILSLIAVVVSLRPRRS